LLPAATCAELPHLVLFTSTFTAPGLLFAGSTNIRKMGKKKTPEEKAARALENGFDDSDDDMDDSLVLKEVLDYTEETYTEQMDMWRV